MTYLIHFIYKIERYDYSTEKFITFSDEKWATIAKNAKKHTEHTINSDYICFLTFSLSGEKVKYTFARKVLFEELNIY